MSSKVIITCAVTGGATPPDKHPGLPVTPREIADSSIDAARAGASIVHIHVRDPKSGGPSMKIDYYEEVVERIRDSNVDVIINLTTGAGARFVPGEDDPRCFADGTLLKSPEVRVEHVLKLKPEICTLDLGSMNFGGWVLINTPRQLTKMANAIKAVGVKPELEVFDTGHIRLAKKLIADGTIESPAMFQLCLGIAWGAAQTTETMLFMRDQLPPGSHWAAFGIGAGEFPMVAQSLLLGGHVRVGLEDNLYIEKGVYAPSNAALVDRAKKIAEILGRTVASADDARQILGLSAGSAL